MSEGADDQISLVDIEGARDQGRESRWFYRINFSPFINEADVPRRRRHDRQTKKRIATTAACLTILGLLAYFAFELITASTLQLTTVASIMRTTGVTRRHPVRRHGFRQHHRVAGDQRGVGA